MATNAKSKFLINTKNIKQAVEEYKNIVFQVHSLDPKIEKNISNVLTSVLKKTKNIKIKNVLFTIIRELLVNAIKANTKRIHFNKKNLNIENEADYKKGIKDFKDAMAANPEEFVELLFKNNLFVQVSISYQSDPITISVINNSSLSPTEKKRIMEQRKKAQMMENLSEVIEEIVDFSEGAGLGIPMIVMMLRNTGSQDESFNIYSDDNYTKAQLSVPKLPNKGKMAMDIAEKILMEIDSLPAFPENIAHLQRLINDGNSTITQIASIVKRDPSLTADLLRMANSAGYATYKRIESIDEALKNIGLQSFNGILTAVGAFNIIHARYKKAFKDVWDHSLKTAFYAEKLCSELRTKKLKNSAYVAGLLHDLGKIVLLTLHPTTMKALGANIGSINETNPIEEIAFGINHSEMGGLIAGHWNFEDDLVDAIKLHHQPFLASEENKELVYLIYLANFIQDVERGFGDLAQLEMVVYECFNLQEANIPALSERIIASYNKF